MLYYRWSSIVWKFDRLNLKDLIVIFFQVFPEQQMKKKNSQTLTFLMIRKDHIQHLILNIPRNPSRD